ncbi:hypothetical protein [uncultured Dysosmobacter sp.]|uniref:hypothetical protein n=1 Tax=uncultured Dysosmobacter sp. TaxID=2591384 RepID=UPI00260DF8A0|nr:hypothetical protein [uncultured Dysosmobacter sp.]
MTVSTCGQAEQRQRFLEQFKLCQPVLSALGDPNRQLIIRTLIENCDKGGLRVGEIQKSSHISRTAGIALLKNCVRFFKLMDYITTSMQKAAACATWRHFGRMRWLS